MNIIIIVTTQRIEIETLHKKIHKLQFCDLYLAAENWVSNFASLFSGTLPSHHGVWNENQSLGMHTVSFPKILAGEGYNSLFFGNDQYHLIAHKMGFQKVSNKSPFSNGDKSSHFPASDQSNFIFWRHENDDLPLNNLILNNNIIEHSLVCILSLSAKKYNKNAENHGLDHRSPFLNEIRVPIWIVNGPKHKQKAKTLLSIVDIFPIVLDFLKIKRPYPIIGKRHRNSTMYEHTDGSKTVLIMNGQDEFKITVFHNQEHGEIYNIIKDPEELHNLWDEPSFKSQKADFLLQFLWAQLDKEVMPMPRIAGA